MEISGKIIAVMPEQGGVSKAGNEWKKQEYVLETHDQYPKKVCFQIFGADKIAQAAINAGEEVTVHFDIDSREYQGRWYTNINAWRVDHAGANEANGAPTQTTNTPNIGNAALATASPLANQDFPPADPVDDLPF